jgi:ectoine hydroxylase-related dioxygenase (phytanoyl-CoA dioxygenase family)
MLCAKQVKRFHQDGYLIVSGFNSALEIEEARSRIEPLFRGEFETGLQPDEWNWRQGQSDETLARQICNGWKSDRHIARLVLAEKVGQACAELMAWPGTRINQDNVIWKPPGARALGFHQDDSYQDWIEPTAMVTCWMALDQTRDTGGTIEYVRGSNHWPVETGKFTFHAPEDYHEGLKHAAKDLGISDYQIDRIEVEPGDVVFHHGRTWHGSGANQTSQVRRSVVSHCMSSECRFHPDKTNPVYSRYKKHGSLEMDESFFPIIYHEEGYRSPSLELFTRR